LRSEFILDLPRYKRQYAAYINEHGEKEVWINCMCSVDDGWRDNIIMVRDGGSCYFNLTINLTKQLAYDLSINGEA